MEDVEQRRQRLVAMREQAAQQDAIASTPMAPLGANPLDTFSTDAALSESADVKSSSFDFYTDPLAGFSSGAKRRKPGSGLISTPSAAHHPTLSSPNANLRQSFVPPNASHSQRRHAHPSLSPPWQPTPYPPGPPSLPVPSFAQPQLPQFHLQPPPYSQQQAPDQGGGWNGASGILAGGRAYSLSSTIGRGHPPGRECTPNGLRGRGNRSSGRGSPGSSWNGNRGAGRARGYGQSGGRNVSAREEPHLFFRKSMVQDPWQPVEASKLGRT